MGKQSEATLLVRIKEVGAEALGKVRDGLDYVASAAKVAAAALAAFLVYSVKQYADAEKASKSLSIAIRNQGLDVETLKRQYEELAEAIQAKTQFEDDEIIAALAVGQAMAGRIALTKELIEATVDYAAATETDLKSAFEKVGKAIGTTTNALAREGIELDTTATKAQKMAKITAQLSQRFQGMAEAQAQGLGAFKQLTNAMGNFAESIGKVVSPKVGSLTKMLIDLVNAATRRVPEIARRWVSNFDHIHASTYAVFESIHQLWAASADNAMRIFGGIKDVIAGAFSFDSGQMQRGIEALTDRAKFSVVDLQKTYQEAYRDRRLQLDTAMATEAEAEEKAAAATLKVRQKLHQEVKDDRVVMHESTLGELKKADEETFREVQETIDKEALESTKARLDEEVEMQKNARETAINMAEAGASGGLKGMVGAGLSSLANTFIPGIGGFVGQVFNLLSQDSEQFAKSMGELFSVEFIENIASNAPTLIETFVDKLPGMIERLSESFPEIVSRLIETIIENYPKLMITLLKYWYNPAFWAKLAMAIIQAVGDGLANGFKDAWKNIQKIFSGGMKDIFKDFDMSSLTKKFSDGLKNAVSAMSKISIEAIRNAFVEYNRALLIEIPKRLGEFLFVKLPEALRNGATAFIDRLRVHFTEEVPAALRAVFDGIINFFSKTLVEAFSSFIERIRHHFLVEVPEAIRGAIGSIGTAISDAFGRAVGSIKEGIDSLVSGIKEAIGGQLKPLQKAFDSFKWPRINLPEWDTPAWVDALIDAIESMGNIGGKGGGDGWIAEAGKSIGFNRGGPVYASGGKLIDWLPKGTDTVPAMLTPGEFVVNRAATQKNMGLLQAINSGGSAGGGSGAVINLNVYGGLLGDAAEARRFAKAIDSELLKLRQTNQSVAFDTPTF
jgi:hypothetical protein